MSKFIFKGYTKRGLIYEFKIGEKTVVVSSNACRYEDALTAAGLPADAVLVRSINFGLPCGKDPEDVHTDIIWSYIGAIPTGKEVASFLVEKGCLTAEQAKEIFGAEIIRIG